MRIYQFYIRKETAIINEPFYMKKKIRLDHTKLKTLSKTVGEFVISDSVTKLVLAEEREK